MPPQEHVKVRRKSTAQPKDASPVAGPRRLDLASPIGPHGETTVKDKIKKWQSQGAGAIAVSDGLAIDVDTEGPTASGSSGHIRSRDASPVKDAFIRKVVEPEVQKATAPKKRVISDGHWVKKIPKPAPPPPPKVVKPEVVWTRKPIKKTDEEIPVIQIAPGLAIAGAGSPVKKRRPSRPSVEKAKVNIPERKPSGIEAWALDVEPTPVHSRAGSRQASESGIFISQAQSEPRKRKPRISDVSWVAGDEDIEIVDFARLNPPRAPRAKTVVDTRDVRERAKELVSGRREQDREKQHEEEQREQGRRSRVRSLSPAAPAPLRVGGRSLAEPAPSIEIRRPRTPPSAPPAIEKYTSKRSRHNERSASRDRSEPDSGSRTASAKYSESEDRAREAELRRLKRSLRERPVHDQHRFTKPETISATDEANEVELRRLKRSLRERKPSYTPSLADNHAVEEVTPRSTKSSISKRDPAHMRTSSEPPMFPKSAPETIPKIFGSRIDAWLASAGDPFVDDGASSSAPSLTQTASTVDSAISSNLTDSIAPSEAISNAQARRERERRRARLREAYDPKLAPKPLSIEKSSPKTPETPLTHRTPKTPASVQETDSEMFAQHEPSTPGSTSTLRRRGARKLSHATVKDRTGSPSHIPSSTSESNTPKEDATVTPPRPPAHTTPNSAEDVVAVLRASSQGSISVDDPMAPADVRRPSFPIRRAFPTTGKRLSTIASVDTLNTRMQNAPPEIAEGSEIVSSVDPNATRTTSEFERRKSSRNSTGLKRRLTKHDDLMSVLSLPKTGKSIASARSIRTGRTRLTDATIDSLMEELITDEKKYMRELRTLVDGVIPVLLSCVLSSNDPAAAASLFGGNTQDEAGVTKPIVEMGVALERLKTCHKRTPTNGPDALLAWAETAEKNYAEYLRTWRLGFKDVVVNLAPADSNAKDSAWEERMPQNEDGDVIDENGERVDVAYLLKRPLVRLKYLARTLKGINMLQPSDRASQLAATFQGLVDQARERMNQERARLEDEAAASIDASRARNPKTMEPLSGVYINPQGFVKARDCFDMHLSHSSGQEMDCRVEIFLRDSTAGQQGNTSEGDVLISEVDALGRWLLFPPIQRNQVSARLGGFNDKLVVMIRGSTSGGQQWHELLEITCDGPEAAQDWLSMFGTTPVPPKLDRSQSFASLKGPTGSNAESSVASSYLSASTAPTSIYDSRAPSPSQVEVPIGEKAGTGSKRWSVAPDENHQDPWRQRKPSYEGNEYESEAPYAGDWSFKSFKAAFRSLAGKDEMLKRGTAARNSSRDDTAPRERFSSHSPNERPRTSGRDRYDSQPGQRSSQRKTSASAPTSPASKNTSNGYSVWYPPSNDNSSDSEGEEEGVHFGFKSQQGRPGLDRRASSVPSKDLPTIPKLRKYSEAVPARTAEDESRQQARGERASTEPPASSSPKAAKAPPARYRHGSRSPSPERKPAPVPPPHVNSATLSPVGRAPPKLEPPSKAARSNHRRTSSPLKHEYQPSTASSSSEGEDDASNDDYSSSDSEADDDDVPLAMLPHLVGNALKPPTPPETIYTPEKGTVAPSQSASQAPYRAVPQVTSKAARAIASIYTWSDKGFWEPLHPDECNIVVTPGLIEVFELSAAPYLNRLLGDDGVQTPSDTSLDKPRPLVALGLTPIVPLRRGTAVDISIRSPALDDSLLKTQAGQNVMLRSRSPEECEVLYHSINYARINNPTWIALQNARGPDPNTSWAARMDRQNASRVDNATGGSESLWSFGRRKSYRAKASRAASTSAMSTSSVGTTASLFSAMRRFSTGGRVFSISKSSVSWRNSMAGSTDSLSGSAGSGASTPPLGTASKRNSMMGGMGGVELPPGTIAMLKVRLYVREVVGSRWRDLGQCKLNIMQPQSAAAPPSPTRETPTPGSASSAPTTSSGGSGGVASVPALLQPAVNDHSPRALQGGMQKRILLQGKGKGETLLDVTLGESSFERVARTGIAVSVWERLQGEVAAKGGVVPGTVRTYMLQTRTERECAYAFSLLGKLRY